MSEEIKRNNKSHEKSDELDVMGVGLQDIDNDLIDEAMKSIHEPITLTPLDKIPPTLRVWNKKKKSIVQGRSIIYAASGPETVTQSKLKVMSDPLKTDTRKDLSECAISEPNLSSSIDRRTEALFEDGINLELELASTFNPETGVEFTPDELTLKITEQSKDYFAHLSRLKTWVIDMHIDELMRDAEAVSFVQGRNATMMLPGILDLEPNALPVLVETIFADDLKEVIVDVGHPTKRIVAVKTNLDGKKLCRSDEMVYLVRGVKKALKREGKFYGISALEPILIIAKILKRIYNYDASEAVVAAYVTKILFRVSSDGNQKGLKKRIESLLAEYAKRGKHAFATFDDVKSIDPIAVKVDWAMLDGIESQLVHLILAITGVPSSMANREQNLNRDLAIVQAIQFIKFVRNTSEKLIAKAFASQMFTPLLAHLAGQTVAQLPFRVKVTRVKPDKDLNEIWADDLMNKKQDEITNPDETLNKTPIGTDVFAANGPSGFTVTTSEGIEYHVKRDS